MNDQIITIGRQFGSGGREIGQTIAKKLDIPFYDKELITMAAEQSGISAEVFEKADEKASNTLLYALLLASFPMSVHTSQINELPLNDRLFIIQFDIVKRIAKAGPCVIVGRCASYMLRDRNDVVKAFIHAPTEARVERVRRVHALNAKDALEMIQKTDKRRSMYYSYFTDTKWSDLSNYDLAINSAQVGVEGAADMIIDFAERKSAEDKKKA